MIGDDPNGPAPHRRVARTGKRTTWTFGAFLFPLLVLPSLSTGGFGEAIEVGNPIWQYALVFIFAAIPWFEILVVIPPSIGLGLNPGLVAALAGLGNLLPIYGIIWFHGRLSSWWERRQDDSSDGSKRFRRSKRLWDRYGVAGLSLLSPILTGIHLATLVSLLLGASRRSVFVWMTITITIWTIALTVGSVYGLSFLGLTA